MVSRDDSPERDDPDGALDELLESLGTAGRAGGEGPEASKSVAEWPAETSPGDESYWTASRMPLTSCAGRTVSCPTSRSAARSTL